MWSAGLGVAGLRDPWALELRPERGVDRAGPLEALHLLEGVDALDEVVAERGRERRDDVVERRQPPRELGDRRARHSDREVRRAQRRRELPADRLLARRRDGRQAHADRADLAGAERDPALRRRSCGRSRPCRCGSPGRARAPACGGLERRGEAERRAGDAAADERARRARGRIRTVTSFERRGQPARRGTGRGSRAARGSRKLPSPRTRADGDERRSRAEVHARVGRGRAQRPTKSIRCRYVVAFGAFRVSVGRGGGGACGREREQGDEHGESAAHGARP